MEFFFFGLLKLLLNFPTMLIIPDINYVSVSGWFVSLCPVMNWSRVHPAGLKPTILDMSWSV